jgi:hypothetical protein
LIVSQLLTLYTTPVIYLTFDRMENWVKRHRSGPEKDAANPGPVPFSEMSEEIR